MARTAYSLKIVDMNGVVSATINDAQINSVTWSLTEFGALEFTLPLNHPAHASVQPLKEVQLWRGTKMLWWGVLIQPRANASTMTFRARTLEWYFSRRVIGVVPRAGRFGGGGFEQGVGGWTAARLPGSDPDANPVLGTTKRNSVAGGFSLELVSSGGRTKQTKQNASLFTTAEGSTLSTDGQTTITGIVNDTIGDNPRITVNVYYSNELSASEARTITEAKAASIEAHILTVKTGAVVYASGLGEADPIESNATLAGRLANRRAEFSYRNTASAKGHKQYAWKNATIKNPVSSKRWLKATFRGWCFIEDFAGPAANNWGLVLERQSPTIASKDPALSAAGYKKVFARKVVPITKNTPTNRWIRMEATLGIPPDGKNYVIEGRLFPPLGSALWDEVDLFTDDALQFVDADESEIVKKLIDHAQDTAIGKTSFNIGTAINPTGITRTRRYRYVDRENVLDLLREFPTLHNGAEWDIEVTPTTRTFTTYFPRKARDTEYALTYGVNVIDFDVDIDSDQTSSSVIILKEGDDAAREEASVQDASLLSGMILEKAYDATPGSAVSSLRPQAVRGLERYRDDVTMPTVYTDPRKLDDLLDGVATGDVVKVDVKKGWFSAVGKYRVQSITLTPDNDQLAFEITAEDEKVAVIVGWNSTWSYFTQDQVPITGSANTTPVESNPEYALSDVSAWATGKAPFGWSHTAPGGAVTNPETVPNTVITKKHEVWLRKTVQCSSEMYLGVKVDRFAYMYVNGNLITGTYTKGQNKKHLSHRGPFRVPDKFLDPSGTQIVALHVQDALADYGNGTDHLVADMIVKGVV